ncbi:MAG: class I SAM-dependent methyltransferase [Acidimicrobiales bacterium]
MGDGELTWDGSRLRVDGTEFLVAVFRGDLTTDERFVIWKTRPLLEASLRLIDRLGAKRIVELGIAQGGSAALFALHARPDQLVAVDLATERIGPLDRLIETRGLGDRVHAVYGVDQSDRDALLAALAPMGPEPLDLVLDDASHRYDETLASFDLLFPRLRPGGVYAIEDWDWAHHDAAADLAAADPEAAAGWWPGGTALTRLAFELTLATADPSVVRSVQIDRHLVRVTRGPAELDPNTFRLHDHVSRSGAALLADPT